MQRFSSLFIPFLLFALYSQISFAYLALPQTGQTIKLIENDDGDNQKGVTWPPQRFRNNYDGTITDNLTGLMWIKDADCATENVSGATTYQWLDALKFAKDLNNSTLNNHCKNYVNKYTDWRIPNVNEIGSLMRAGLTERTIANWLNIPDNNSTGFSQSNLVDTPIWTSTTSAQSSNEAWTINLRTGGTELIKKSNNSTSAHIFSAVRNSIKSSPTPVLPTGQTLIYSEGDDADWNKENKPPLVRFVKDESGAVLDKLTGLRWIADANCATPDGGNWYEALSSLTIISGAPIFFTNCSSYIPPETPIEFETDQEFLIEQNKAWRIPNITELKSLIAYNTFDPALAVNQPFDINYDQFFWSSTSSNGQNQSNAAWTVDFTSGQINATTDKNGLGYTWPVSGPYNFPDISSNLSHINFGRLLINTPSGIETITINNTGSATLKINSISSLDPHFSVEKNSCLTSNNNKLEIDDSCDIEIRFSPSKDIKYTSSLLITSNAPGLNEYDITLNGTGMITEEKESNPNCFIATAAYGSHLSDEVTLLRNFRDTYLISNEYGKKLVSYYYVISPPIAEKIAQNKELRLVTQVTLTPIIYAIKYPMIPMLCLITLLLFLLQKKLIRKLYCKKYDF